MQKRNHLGLSIIVVIILPSRPFARGLLSRKQLALFGRETKVEREITDSETETLSTSSLVFIVVTFLQIHSRDSTFH